MRFLELKNLLTGWRKSYPVVFFVLSFVLLMITFYLFYYKQSLSAGFLSPLVKAYTRLSSGLLNVMGYKTYAQGSLISSPQFSVDINIGCDAVEPTAIFVAGILSFPVSFRKKISGLIAGIPVFFVMNLVRIISLFIAGVHNKSLFETLHTVIFQITFILMAVGLWLLWLRRVTTRRLS